MSMTPHTEASTLRIRCGRCGAVLESMQDGEECTNGRAWCEKHPLTGREIVTSGKPECVNDTLAPSTRELVEAAFAGHAERIEIIIGRHRAIAMPETTQPPTLLNFTERVRRTADLRMSEIGFTASLSFDMQPHRIFVPWRAIVRVEIAWPHELPAYAIPPVTMGRC